MKKKFMKQLFLPVIIVFVMHSCVNDLTPAINKSSMKLKTNTAMSSINKEARRKELYALLGKLPDQHRPMSVKLISKKSQMK
jgi:hypothetical protein